MTPSEEATNEVSSSALDNTGRHQYTVMGLDASTGFEIRLFPAASVTTTDGVTTFADADDNDQADVGSPSSVIELVTEQFLRAELAERVHQQALWLGGGLVAATTVIIAAIPLLG